MRILLQMFYNTAVQCATQSPLYIVAFGKYFTRYSRGDGRTITVLAWVDWASRQQYRKLVLMKLAVDRATDEIDSCLPVNIQRYHNVVSTLLRRFVFAGCLLGKDTSVHTQVDKIVSCFSVMTSRDHQVSVPLNSHAMRGLLRGTIQ